MCNVVFTTIVDGLNGEQRAEFLAELTEDPDPWKQAEKVYADLEARGYGK